MHPTVAQAVVAFRAVEPACAPGRQLEQHLNPGKQAHFGNVTKLSS